MATEHRHGIEQPWFALTFDDGPSEWTDAILDRLADHKAAATFFVIGSALADSDREETVKRIVDEGSEVGNHTFLHLSLGELQAQDVRDEFARTSSAIERVCNTAPRYWRAPYLRSTDEAASIADELGLAEIRASIVPADYEWPAAETARFVLERLQPGDIVALHDGRPPFEGEEASAPTRRETVLAVEQILRECRARRLLPVTLSALLGN